MVCKEAEKAVSICLMLSERLPYSCPERRELFLLAQKCLSLVPVYTAAHFFNISGYTIVDICGIVTTLYIVLIQFQS